jgi:hypothetical protein
VLAPTEDRDADRERRDRRQQGDLGADAQTGGQAGHEQRPGADGGEHARIALDRDVLHHSHLPGLVGGRGSGGGRAPVEPGPRRIPDRVRARRAVHQEGECRHQEEEPGDIVRCLAGL